MLELTGIGSPNLLREMGIEIKFENSNVGDNSQAHVIRVIPS